MAHSQTRDGTPHPDPSNSLSVGSSPLFFRILLNGGEIEQVLLYYLKGYGPEEIAEQFPALSLDQINATIVYYQQNQAKIDDYLASLKTWQERRYLKFLANPLPIVQRLRSLK